MTPAHRARGNVTRRRLLGVAALAAVPAVTFAGLQAEDRNRPAQATVRTSASSVAARPRVPAGPTVVTAGGGPVPFRPGTAMLGAYLDLHGKTLTQSLALRRQQLGRDERIVHAFYDWSDDLPRSLPGRPGMAIPMVSWRGPRYADILNGRGDALIARAARRLAADKRPTLLRWAWEMNGDWYAWSGGRNDEGSPGYVECWRRLRGIFAGEGASNVSWVWSPNWSSSSNQAWNEIQAYYPGDKYVDWVGVSGYDLHRETPTTLFDPIYRAYSATKPIMITEVGSVDRGGRTKGDWIATFADWVEQRPGVGAVTWFDTDTHPGYNENWRIDTDPASLAAFTAMATSARFSG